MGLIPIPELVAALALTLVLFGVRALRARWTARASRRRRGPAWPPAPHEDSYRRQARLLASCITLVVISIPLIVEIVPPNGSYGFRTPLSRSSPAVWYAANAFMGWALTVAAVISAATLLMLPAGARRSIQWAAFLVPVAGAIVASFMYLNHLV
jgi:hypothetical protein